MSLNENYKLWHKPKQNHYTESGSLKKGETHQGYLHKVYQLRYPEKYIGNPNLIIYRSGLELSFCRWCDASPSIIKWSSEPIKIPYYDKISKLEECKKYGLDPNNIKNWIIRNYNVDFWILIQKGDIQEKWFVEIKPSSKLKKPIPPNETASIKENKKFNIDAREYLINEEKFAAAKIFATKNNSKFFIFTEKTLKGVANQFMINE